MSYYQNDVDEFTKLTAVINTYNQDFIYTMADTIFTEVLNIIAGQRITIQTDLASIGDTILKLDPVDSFRHFTESGTFHKETEIVALGEIILNATGDLRIVSGSVIQNNRAINGEGVAVHDTRRGIQ